MYFQDSYIIDNGEAGVWVWNGKQASAQERKEAMRNAVVCYPKYFFILRESSAVRWLFTLFYSLGSCVVYLAHKTFGLLLRFL